MRDFTEIAVWAKAHEFTLAVYRAVESFPNIERFSLTQQLTRAASSIGANIAEGCGRGGDRELSRFLRIAIGSAFESQNHLLLARDLGYIAPNSFVDLNARIREVQRMIAAFIRKLETDLNKSNLSG